MSWDPVWESIFRQRASWGRYPCEELIRFMARHYYGHPRRAAVRVLELGCGPGGGPGWYLAREGFGYLGLDASPTALARGRDRFAREGLAGTLVRGVFERLPFAAGTFECVVDVASLQCNGQEDSRRVVDEVWRVLRPGGRHFSLTAMAGSYGDGPGERLDPVTLRRVAEGPFADMGVMRFATRESLEQLYDAFTGLELGYVIRSLGPDGHELRHWVVSCQKQAGS